MTHYFKNASPEICPDPAQPAPTTQTSRVPVPRRSAGFRRCPAVLRKPVLGLLIVAASNSATPFVIDAAAQTAPAADMSLTESVVESSQAGSVNINTASADELSATLNGIGGSKAEAIVRYREQFGSFESVEELSEVTGIGAATVEKNRALIRLE